MPVTGIPGSDSAACVDPCSGTVGRPVLGPYAHRVNEVWAEGAAYERYMGRWSTVAARAFVEWLAVEEARRWVDIGCGAGALTGAVVSVARPSRVISVDRSGGFVATARARVGELNAGFVVGDAMRLPLPDGCADVAVSGLLLNFLPDPKRALAEFVRICAPAGVVAAYVWDYVEGMPLLSHFWDAATALDPTAQRLDERVRFDLCRPPQLAGLWERSGLTDVAVQPVAVPMVFADVDDLWSPLLGGQGPAPTYLLSLPQSHRDRFREELLGRLPVQPDGRVELAARAWAVRGTV
jgi:SAM-dependent methyltransferase